MIYHGDFLPGATIHFLWSTNGANGASITRGTNGTVSVYKNNGTTQTTTGVTDTEDFDGLTGVHACTIATTDSFYTPGNYSVVLSGASIDSQTVNAVIGHFSIANRMQAGLVQRGLAIVTNTDATHLQLASGDIDTDDEANGSTVVIVHGTGANQSRIATDSANTNDLLTVDTWTVTPDGTSYYERYASPPGSSTSPAPVNVVQVAGTTQTAGDLAALVTAVDNFVDTEVGAIQTTLTSMDGKLDTIDNFLDTEMAATLAAVDTEVAAIKAKTDSLTFTVANQLDANVQSVNDVALEGDGSATPWGPA